MSRIAYLTGIEFGPGAIASLAEATGEFGMRRPLLVADKGVLAGVSLGRLFPDAPEIGNGLVVAVTETVTPEDIETLAAALEEELA